MNNIDLEALAQEFNMDVEEQLGSPQIPIDDLKSDEQSNPDLVLSTNINKADPILDRVMIEINRVGMTPRLGEVAGQLISTINQSVSQIYTKQFDFGSLRLKKKMVELKEREVTLKELTSNIGKQGGTVNNNLIVTDRETVLKLLKDSKNQIKMLEENVEDKGENDGE